MKRPPAARLALLALVLLPLGPAVAGEGWSRYVNARYGYAIDVPSGLMTMRPAPENDDGRDFEGPGGRSHLAVWGSYNALDQSPAEYAAFLADEPSFGRVTYKAIRKDWLVLSGLRHSPFSNRPRDRIFYLRVMYNRDHSAMSHFEVSYEAEEKVRFDAIVKRLSASLTPPADE